MKRLLVTVPLFDRFLSVEAYLLRLCPGELCGAASPQSIDLIFQAFEEDGVEALAGGNTVFLPTPIELLPLLAKGTAKPPAITTFLLSGLSQPLTQEQMALLQELKGQGYGLAVTQEGAYLDDDKLLKLADCVVFDQEAMAGSNRRAHVIRYKNLHSHLQVMATQLADNDAFRQALRDGFHLFEGKFYRIPVTRSDRELSPLKVNLVTLLNLVRDEDFEFREITEVVRRDPALSYSLMRFINSPYLGIRHKVKSIQHAVTILGQAEVRKWITAAVFKALGSDRASELTRISLIRAKFAENLAEPFALAEDAPSLFLVGLFSALDAMLDTTMEDALSRVLVSDEIHDALAKGAGRYHPVLRFLLDYEQADWDKVVFACGQREFSTDRVFDAYRDALGWYQELITQRPRAERGPRGPAAPARTL